MRRRWFIVGLLVASTWFFAPVILAADSPDATSETPTATPEPTETESVEERLERKRATIERAIHEEVNERRREHGVAPLELRERQSEIAREHSDDMLRDGYYNHTAPDGERFMPECRPTAENIYQVQASLNSPELAAEWTVDAWMQSDAHREILLDPRWESQGMGVAIQWGGPQFVTQNFC